MKITKIKLNIYIQKSVVYENKSLVRRKSYVTGIKFEKKNRNSFLCEYYDL